MWAYESVFYQIYPIGFCGAPRVNDGVTEALNAGSDYTISGQTLTLKKSALERYRKDGTAVVFSADLADGTAYALVIDYVKRK